MRILAEGTKTYPDDPARHFEFGRFAGRAGDFWLAAGHFDFETLRPLAGQRVVYLDLGEPNSLLGIPCVLCSPTSEL